MSLLERPVTLDDHERRARWGFRFAAVIWLVLDAGWMFNDESVRVRDGVVALCIAAIVGLAGGLAARHWVPDPLLRDRLTGISKRSTVLLVVAVGTTLFALAVYLRLWTELLGLESRPLRLFNCSIAFAAWTALLVRAPVAARVQRMQSESKIARLLPVPPRPDSWLA